jgi:hypothetical protein
MGDTWLSRALTDGLNCPSGDVVTSAEEKTVESVAEEARWLRGGEYGGGGAGTPSVNWISLCIDTVSDMPTFLLGRLALMLRRSTAT